MASHRHHVTVCEVNVSFDESEMQVLRSAAERAGQSLEEYVHDAAMLRASRRSGDVASAAKAVAKRSVELNRRLRDE